MELIMLGAGAFSTVVAVISDYPTSALYSLVFIFVICCIGALVRSMTPFELLRVISVALLLCMAIHVGTGVDDLVSALSVTVTDTGLFRFTPLGMHPNLTGLVYSGLAGLLFVQALQPIYSTVWRVTCGVCAAVAVVLVVAASARSSLLALAFTGVVATIRSTSLQGGAKRLPLVLALLVVGGVVLATSTSALDWLGSILEVDSDTRGIESGGTGRTELWMQGMNLLWDNTRRFTIGGGLRSAEYDIIGFFVENSYITLLLELGVIVGTAVIAGYLTVVLSLFKHVGKWSESRMGWMLPFVVILFSTVTESFFNRYLISIGNPLSLTCLMLLIGSAVYRRQADEPAPAYSM
jgi:hypothetical protein